VHPIAALQIEYSLVSRDIEAAVPVGQVAGDRCDPGGMHTLDSER